MGNCIAVEEKVAKVMRPDGKILEYTTPIHVNQILSDFPGQFSAVVSASVNHHHQQQPLLPDSKLLGGHLYCLVPIPCSSSPSPPQLVVKKTKKKVRFSIPEEQSKKDEEEAGSCDEEKSNEGVVRIKLVISKSELEELLRRGGVSVSDMVSNHLQGQKQRLPVKEGAEEEEEADDDHHHCWKPALESIPELGL
ncbi:Uncharacterized protein At1g66480 [Linum perenne]